MRGDEENISAVEERYKEAKNVVARVKGKAYEKLYKRLDSKEGENDIYRIAKARKKRKMDLGSVRFIKDEDGRSIVNDMCTYNANITRKTVKTGQTRTRDGKECTRAEDLIARK
ncbi:hypothetical protein Tco_0834776, partial [Tanacetum coccineum]